MNGAEALVRMLLEYRVEVVFGVPGDTSLPLYEAFYHRRQKIRHVMARDERSASFMADAYARIAHKPGLCECPSGAGALYSVPGVAEANASSIPVILFTSGISLSDEGKGTITELDHHKLFEPITKWSSFLKQTTKIPETVRRAFRIATSGRPGAVHLAFPQETLTGEIPEKRQNIYGEKDCVTYPAYRTRGSQEVLEEVANHLQEAGQPVIVAGGGANHSQASEEVMSLSEWLGAPVVTTISGQGIVPDDHPLALGVVGDNGFHPHALQAVEEADLLLYVGCKMGSVSTLKWTLPSHRPDRKIIQIDLDPTLLSNNFQNTLSVAGDAKLVVEDLVTLLRKRGKGRKPSDWVRNLNEARTRFWRDSEPALQSAAIPIKPQHIIHALNRRLPSPSIVIADAGTPTPYLTRFLKLQGEGSRFIIPRSYGGLGYAIPAVVGASFARPKTRIIGLFGDGSLGMSAGELETLSRLEIPAVLIHFNNGCFGWIKALQGLHPFDRAKPRFLRQRGKTRLRVNLEQGSRKDLQAKFFSVDFTPGNMAIVAEGFGLKAFHIETPGELEEGLDEAFSVQEPVFLDIVTESLLEELPPVHSWLKTEEKRKGRRRHSS
ncbi:MAG TPA: thiamine pyrophosphate-binding protein [Thermodesulfobacteriota bacterium]|nr:thiamine pyrophosphate-binding protein [Thermodesulfobacteriota bacterium]